MVDVNIIKFIQDKVQKTSGGGPPRQGGVDSRGDPRGAMHGGAMYGGAMHGGEDPRGDPRHAHPSMMHGGGAMHGDGVIHDTVNQAPKLYNLRKDIEDSLADESINDDDIDITSYSDNDILRMLNSITKQKTSQEYTEEFSHDALPYRSVRDIHSKPLAFCTPLVNAVLRYNMITPQPDKLVDQVNFAVSIGSFINSSDTFDADDAMEHKTPYELIQILAPVVSKHLDKSAKTVSTVFHN